MELGARTALLLALAYGPGFGLELITRVKVRTGGLLRLNRGGIYLALRSLERKRLVHGWTRRLPGKGRPRRYYELTAEGILSVEQLRRSLLTLTRTEGRSVTAIEAEQMAARVSEAGGLSAFAIQLRDAGRRARLS